MSLNRIESLHKNRFKITDSYTLDSGVTIPCICGQCGQVDVISKNGYRYKRGFWDKVLSDELVINSINSRDNFGMLEHPEDDNHYLVTPYDQASHVIMKAWVENGNPFATFGLLNNEKGNQIKALIDVGHHPGVSTRGLGSFCKDSISQFIDENNYMFITWDIVRNPNFGDLRMDKVTDSMMKSSVFKELVQMHELKDSADEHFCREKLLKEMNLAINDILDRHGIMK